MKLSILAYSLSSFSLACSALDAAPRLIHSSDLLDAQVYQLDNGLTVYLSKNTQSPSLYAEIAVRCGSYQDPEHATGLSHYLEHLMFKGTKNIGTSDFQKEKVHLDKITELYEKHKLETDPEKRKEIYKEINSEAKLSAKYTIANDLDRIYKKIGGSGVNAHCSKEETVYKVNIPANQLENWAKIESERFSNPIFRLFHTELETVYEEKNRALDDSSRIVFNTLQRNLYPNHPYGESTLGKTEHLKNPSIKDIYSHFNAFYVPNNMAVIISGDIEIDSTLKLIDTHFSKLEMKPLPERKPPTLESLKGVKRITVEFQSDESIAMAWRTTPLNHPDEAALQMLDMILDNQVAGLINLNLTQAQKVRSAGSYPYALNHAGAQYMYAYPREGQSLEELETLLLEQVQLIKDGQFEDWILDAIIKDLKTSEEEDAESNQMRVEQMRDSFIAGETWNRTVQQQSRYAQVTKEDIIRVANKYFNDDYVVVQLIKGTPDIKHVEKPQIDPIDLNANAESAFASALYKNPIVDIKPRFIEKGVDYEETTSAKGITYFTVKNPINNLFTLTWHFPKGSAQDDILSAVIPTVELSGTSELTPVDLKKQWYKLGVDAQVSSGEHATSFSLSGPQSSLEDSLALFLDWINNPNIDAETLNKVVSDIKKNRSTRLTDPRTIIHAMARQSRHGDQSRYLAELSSEQLDALTPKDITESLQQLFAINHTVSYIGQLASNEWIAKIPEPAKVVQYTRPLSKSVKTELPVEIHFFHREMAQAQVWIESYAGEWDIENTTSVNLFNEYFDGGMSGVVFQEMREARGLAYSAYGFNTAPTHPESAWLNIGGIGCQADKTIEAVQQFFTIFDKLEITEQRFNESRDALMKRYSATRTNFRNIPDSLIYWKNKGYTEDPNKVTLSKLGDFGIAELKKFHSSYVAEKNKRICIVGDRDQIDIEKLKQIGNFKEVTSDDIFSQ